MILVILVILVHLGGISGTLRSRHARNSTGGMPWRRFGFWRFEGRACRVSCASCVCLFYRQR